MFACNTDNLLLCACTFWFSHLLSASLASLLACRAMPNHPYRSTRGLATLIYLAHSQISGSRLSTDDDSSGVCVCFTILYVGAVTQVVVSVETQHFMLGKSFLSGDWIVSSTVRVLCAVITVRYDPEKPRRVLLSDRRESTCALSLEMGPQAEIEVGRHLSFQNFLLHPSTPNNWPVVCCEPSSKRARMRNSCCEEGTGFARALGGLDSTENEFCRNSPRRNRE